MEVLILLVLVLLVVILMVLLMIHSTDGANIDVIDGASKDASKGGADGAI